MDLLKYFPEADMRLLHYYFSSYGDYYESPNYDNMSYIMRVWAQNKKALYEMFHQNFILKKDFMFEKTLQELSDEMYNKIWNERFENPEVYRFAREFERNITHYFCGSDLNNLYRFISDYAMLVENVYDGNTFVINFEDESLTVPNGCKAVKMLGKIAKLFGMDMEAYEAFRIAHSMVLNQRKIKGNLCLSIHPMDYVTMSDNTHDWTSCMCWIEEAGDYRLGTIEMMNSPYVVVAYIESENEYLNFCYKDYKWNSKRWRQLFIVTPDLILGNKQYPYNNDFLQGAAIQWLKELATTCPGYGPYGEEAINIENHSTNYIDGKKAIYFKINSDYMYNDVYDLRLAYFNPNYKEKEYALNFSGPAICICCGEVIPPGWIDAHKVICSSCSGEFRCYCCGEDSSGECYTVDGHQYCEYCYENDLIKCDICGDHHLDEHIRTIYLAVMDKDYKGDFNWRYSVKICQECFENKEYESYFGPLLEMRKWGHFDEYVFDVKNLTDDGLFLMELSSRTDKYILAMKEATTLEEMKAVDEKYNRTIANLLPF